MRLSYDEYDKIEETAKKKYQKDYPSGIKIPTQAEVDNLTKNLDKDNLIYLLCCLEETPKDDDQNEILKYIRIKLYQPEVLTLTETDPLKVTYAQMKAASQVVQYMGDNIFADEWFPTMDDISRLLENMDNNSFRFLLYIGHIDKDVLTPHQAEVQEYARGIIRNPDYIEIME
ncbi:MAG: hypothetical protein J6N70_19270 [Oribacterium sp.]|nr:hypothetical protein [Oribacterium sp.]